MQLNDILGSHANREAILVRLKAKCVTAGELNDPHWIYSGSHQGDGQFFLNHREVAPRPGQIHIPKGKTVSARRLMYLLHFERIPDGEKVETVCKIKACMNPAHLTVPGQEVFEQAMIENKLKVVKKQKELEAADLTEIKRILQDAKPVERYRVVK
jgi:hypothetical protein